MTSKKKESKELTYDAAVDLSIRYFLQERKKAQRRGHSSVRIPISNGCGRPIHFSPFFEYDVKCLCFIAEQQDKIGNHILELLRDEYMINATIVTIPRKGPFRKGERKEDHWLDLEWINPDPVPPYYVHEFED